MTGGDAPNVVTVAVGGPVVRVAVNVAVSPAESEIVPVMPFAVSVAVIDTTTPPGSGCSTLNVFVLSSVPYNGKTWSPTVTTEHPPKPSDVTLSELANRRNPDTALPAWLIATVAAPLNCRKPMLIQIARSSSVSLYVPAKLPASSDRGALVAAGVSVNVPVVDVTLAPVTVPASVPPLRFAVTSKSNDPNGSNTD